MTARCKMGMDLICDSLIIEGITYEVYDRNQYEISRQGYGSRCPICTFLFKPLEKYQNALKVRLNGRYVTKSLVRIHGGCLVRIKTPEVPLEIVKAAQQNDFFRELVTAI